jgi:hypothetical protein
MWLGGRLKEAVAQRKKFLPRGHEVAGREAEEHLTKIIAAGIKGTHWRIWEGLRIPNKNGRRREIDCIVVGGEEVLLIEQKHWSGNMEVIQEDGKEKVIQHRRSGEEMDHGDVFGTIKLKGTILQHHHGASEFFSVSMRPFVIFSNRNLEVPPSVQGRDDCWSLNDILNYLPNSGGDDPSKDGLSPADAALAATLDRLGSWDTLHLWGGHTINGDVFSTSTNSGPIEELFYQHRDRITKIRVNADRSLLKALFKRPRLYLDIADKDGVFDTCEAFPDGKLNYKRAGSSQRRSIEWRHITGIELTSRVVDDEDGVPRAPTDFSQIVTNDSGIVSTRVSSIGGGSNTMQLGIENDNSALQADESTNTDVEEIDKVEESKGRGWIQGLAIMFGLAGAGALTQTKEDCREVLVSPATTFNHPELGHISLPPMYETVCQQVPNPSVEGAIFCFGMVIFLEIVLPIIRLIRGKGS